VIVAIDGRAVNDSDDVAAAVASKRPGDSVEIEYYRGDDQESVTVELSKRPATVDSGGSQQDEDDGGGLLP
jgi:serine protease Do